MYNLVEEFMKIYNDLDFDVQSRIEKLLRYKKPWENKLVMDMVMADYPFSEIVYSNILLPEVQKKFYGEILPRNKHKTYRNEILKIVDALLYKIRLYMFVDDGKTTYDELYKHVYEYGFDDWEKNLLQQKLHVNIHKFRDMLYELKIPPNHHMDVRRLLYHFFLLECSNRKVSVALKRDRLIDVGFPIDLSFYDYHDSQSINDDDVINVDIPDNVSVVTDGTTEYNNLNDYQEENNQDKDDYPSMPTQEKPETIKPSEPIQDYAPTPAPVPAATPPAASVATSTPAAAATRTKSNPTKSPLQLLPNTYRKVRDWMKKSNSKKNTYHSDPGFTSVTGGRSSSRKSHKRHRSSSSTKHRRRKHH